jgi:catechol 2,3-dioxygenase-like lactoylglutathione lyase family enzyme
MLARYPVRQIAYVVDDVRAAALAHHRLYGSGPFFVADHIPVRLALHRGREGRFDHSSAYGQWGNQMIEFMCQHDDAPSAVRDLYAPGEEGFHHVAIIVDDLARARADFAAEGFVEALYAEMNDGFAFVMMDAVARYGHMIELYEGVPALTGFYDFVADAARGFDGSDPVRTISMG